MRVWKLTIPLGAILMAGGFWLRAQAQPHFEGIADEIPRHKITDQMVLASKKFQGIAAPNFALHPVNGPAVSLNQLWNIGPVFIIFILHGCPCSIEAEPFFQSLYSGFDGKVTFIGITNGTPAQAKKWVHHFQVPFPVVSDSSLDVMKAFHAQESTYSALILPGGTISREWPGYDQAILQDIEANISRDANLSYPDLDFSQAPIRPTSGCFFYGEPAPPVPRGN